VVQQIESVVKEPPHCPSPYEVGSQSGLSFGGSGSFV
jgi:hypothetical protein